MDQRRFFDIFKRYSPTGEKRALLESAHGEKFRYRQNPMQVEVELSFDRHYPADLLYEIEDECRTLYEAASFKIILNRCRIFIPHPLLFQPVCTIRE